MSFKGEAELILEITDCKTMPFSRVTWEFAKQEGEYENLDEWRADHRAYFDRNGGFDPEMPLVCETFRVVEDLRPKAYSS